MGRRDTQLRGTSLGKEAEGGGGGQWSTYWIFSERSRDPSCPWKGLNLRNAMQSYCTTAFFAFLALWWLAGDWLFGFCNPPPFLQDNCVQGRVYSIMRSLDYNLYNPWQWQRPRDITSSGWYPAHSRGPGLFSVQQWVCVVPLNMKEHERAHRWWAHKQKRLDHRGNLGLSFKWRATSSTAPKLGHKMQ